MAFAHPIYDEIESRLLEGAIAALKQANQHAVFLDPGNEHWQRMSIVNAAHAGELFIKAAIARVHPLLIFQNVFELDTLMADQVSLEEMIKRGRSHDFSKLPNVLWATTRRRIADLKTYKETHDARNAVQHFVHTGVGSLGDLSLRFIYNVIDPLINEEFGLFAVEHHEDHHVGLDYVVDAIVRSGLKFSVPAGIDLTEVSLWDSYKDQPEPYKAWLESSLTKVGKKHLLEKPVLS